jgi:hypothetical protein
MAPPQARLRLRNRRIIRIDAEPQLQEIVTNLLHAVILSQLNLDSEFRIPNSEFRIPN